MPREWDHPYWSFEMGSVLLPQRPQSSYFARVTCQNFLPLEGGVIFWQQIWGVKWLTSPSPPPSLSRLPQKLRLIPQGGRSQHTGHHLDLQPVTNLQLRLGDVILVWPCRVPGSSHSAARFTTFHMMHVHNFEQSKLNFQSQKESFKYLSPGPAMQQQQPVTWTSDISSWPRPVPSMPPAYIYTHRSSQGWILAFRPWPGAGCIHSAGLIPSPGEDRAHAHNQRHPHQGLPPLSPSPQDPETVLPPTRNDQVLMDLGPDPSHHTGKSKPVQNHHLQRPSIVSLVYLLMVCPGVLPAHGPV